MKKFKQFILVILVLSLVSCSFGFVDSNYYKQRRYSAQVSVDEIVDDSTDNAGDIVISEDEAAEIQNLFDTIGIDEHFDGKKLESWVFYVTDLSSSNVPSYKFDNNGSWENKGHYDFYPKHNNAGSGLKAISNLEYYRYKTRKARYIGENDFDPSDDPNFTEEMLKREERFLFFKFTGKSNGPALNNSIFAVDTHSKFCFLYDEPGNLSVIFGNKVPSLWQDYADPRTEMGNNHKKAYKTPFYMYDPVGYVTEDGDVIVYDWAKKNIENSNYGPSTEFSAPAERSPDKPGRSPYLPEGASKLKAKAKSIENVSIAGMDKSWVGVAWEKEHPVDRGIFNYKLEAFGEVLTELNEKKEVKIDKNAVADILNSKEKSLNNPTMDIVLGIELSKHDVAWHGAYEWKGTIFSEINNCPISTLSSPVKLMYNSGTFTPVLPTSLPEGVTCSFVDTDFTLKKGETKDFSIKYTVNRPDVHCVGDVIVTYELSWE